MKQTLPSNSTLDQRSLIIAISIIGALTIGVILAFSYAKGRPSEIVLPAGGTYLGPSPTGTTQTVQKSNPQTILVPGNDAWVTYAGKKYPYAFSHPKSLSLGFFPDDPYDAVTIFWNNTVPEENLLLRVETHAGSIKTYAEDWWKQYSAWKGVGEVEEFTNAKGLKGYRASYIDGSGKSPFEHIFFEVPDRTDQVIWMSGKLLPRDVFAKIVDSVSWTNQ